MVYVHGVCPNVLSNVSMNFGSLRNTARCTAVATVLLKYLYQAGGPACTAPAHDPNPHQVPIPGWPPCARLPSRVLLSAWATAPGEIQSKVQIKPTRWCGNTILLYPDPGGTHFSHKTSPHARPTEEHSLQNIIYAEFKICVVKQVDKIALQEPPLQSSEALLICQWIFFSICELLFAH